jgi:hypothetical protein
MTKKQPKFSAEAIATFRRMQVLEGQCECPELDWLGEYWKHEMCEACEEYLRLHSRLHGLLHLQPWELAVQNPAYEGNPDNKAYPKPDREAQARYRELDKSAHASQ